MSLYSQYQLTLASTSPRRKELLNYLGIPFKILAPHVDESLHADLSIEDRCQKLASLKAHAARLAGGGNKQGEFILAADTLVEIGGMVFEKPSSIKEAKEMLRQLSGKEHRVITGVSLLHNDQKGNWCENLLYAQSMVTFHALSEKLIDHYLLSGDSLDKAGAYGIQGFGMVFVRKIMGTFSNVVGLPLDVIVQSLENYPWPEDRHWAQIFI